MRCTWRRCVPSHQGYQPPAPCSMVIAPSPTSGTADLDLLLEPPQPLTGREEPPHALLHGNPPSLVRRPPPTGRPWRRENLLRGLDGMTMDIWARLGAIIAP